MSRSLSAVTTGSGSDPVRAVLRFGIAAGAAALGARSISTALTRAWISTKAVDSAAGTINRTVK